LVCLSKEKIRRNGIKQNGIRRYEIRRNENRQNEIKRNATQPKNANLCFVYKEHMQYTVQKSHENAQYAQNAVTG